MRFAGYDWVRAFWALLGVAVIGLGAAILRVIGVGVDPYTAANIGIGDRLGIGLGAYQLISNAVLFVPMLLVGRRYIGLGTLLNMTLTGFFVQGFTALLQPHVDPTPDHLHQTLLFVVGILVFAFGASTYMTAGLGTAPYDALAPIVVDHSRLRYRLVRVVQDLVFLGLALAFGGPVGIGTVMTAFFAGPLIDLLMTHVNGPLLARDKASFERRHPVTVRPQQPDGGLAHLSRRHTSPTVDDPDAPVP